LASVGTAGHRRNQFERQAAFAHPTGTGYAATNIRSMIRIAEHGLGFHAVGFHAGRTGLYAG
jgi:hypothetical protein